jgi:hypothetical protein
MRVQTLFTDDSGTWKVLADVRENNRSVQIIEIRDDEYGGEADLDDFSDAEKAELYSTLLEEYDRLNGESEVDDDLPSDY